MKGGGVSALATAWHLQQSSACASASVGARNDANPNLNPTKIDVQLFEAEDRLGGHAHTIQVGKHSIVKLISVSDSWPSRVVELVVIIQI